MYILPTQKVKLILHTHFVEVKLVQKREDTEKNVSLVLCYMLIYHNINQLLVMFDDTMILKFISLTMV